MLLPPGWINNDGEYTLDYCPLCGKDNHFNWNIQGEYGHCWVCDGTITGYSNLIKAAPNVREVSIKVGSILGKNYRSQRERGEVHFQNAWDSPVREYLKNRNINEATSYEVPFMYDASSGVISVQLDGSSPELPPLTMYRWPKEGSKWLVGSGGDRKFYAFNLKRFEGTKKNILLCEGLFDIVSPGFLNYGISLCGSKISESIVGWLDDNVGGIAIWLDDDEAGLTGEKKISHMFDIYGIEYTIIKTIKPPKDHRWSNPDDVKVLRQVKDYLENK